MKHRIEAKRLFNQAHLAYKNGDYEEAILKWQQSYELSREPLIFESIANAYERLGQSRRALENLKEWRKVAPWREHKTLDSRIERLEQRVKDEEAEQQRKAAEEKRARDLEASRQPQLGPSAPPRDDVPTSAAKVAGFSLIGVGGALTAAGVTLALVANSKRPDLDRACAEASGQTLCLASDRDAIESTNAMAIGGDIGWIVGAATVAAGLTLVLTAPNTNAAPPASATSWRMRPMAAPSGGGALLEATF